MTHTTHIGMGALLALGACGLDTPGTPTWADDVRPILAANCVHCHGYPAVGGAPDSFRLDRYDDWVAPNGRVIRGAATMAYFMALRTSRGEMPPRFPLDQRQRQILADWAELGVSQSVFGSPGVAPPSGMPRRDNADPRSTIIQPLMESLDADGVLHVHYQIRDPDHDIVHGELRVGADLASSVVVDGTLHSGRGTATWDVAAFAEGGYQLFAVLDDGIASSTHELGSYDVSHANTAPTVTLTRPQVFDIITAADINGGYTVNFDVVDPDVGDVLTYSLVARRGTESVPLATDMPAIPGTNIFPLTDTSALAEGPGWRFELSVSDGTATRAASSGPIVIGHRTTQVPFSQIGPIFVSKCTPCHLGDNSTDTRFIIPNVDHALTDFDDTNGAKGADSLRGLLYRRVVQQRNMPPPSSAAYGGEPLTSAQLQAVEDWLLSGGGP